MRWGEIPKKPGDSVFEGFHPITGLLPHVPDVRRLDAEQLVNYARLFKTPE